MKKRWLLILLLCFTFIFSGCNLQQGLCSHRKTRIDGILIRCANCGLPLGDNKNPYDDSHQHEYIIREAQPSDCYTHGWEEYRECITCGAGSEDKVELPLTRHTMNFGGQCKYCTHIFETAGVTYELNATQGGYEAVAYERTADAFLGDEWIALTAVIEYTSTTGVAAEVFRGCTHLKELCLGAGIHYLGSRAFADCPNLEKVIVGADFPVDYAENAFENCPSLKEVDYASTVEAWKTNTAGKSLFADGVIVHCVDGDIVCGETETA